MSNSSQRCVAIIGAGISGLVTAVNMLKVGIRPMIFDKTSGIGGMWNADLKPCWNSMRVNISKFLTGLSDFSWPRETQLFPNQREVFTYLSDYVRRSLPSDIFRFNTQVTNVYYDQKETNPRWIVQSRTMHGEISSENFDFVVVASGFFDSPHMPQDILGLSSFQGTILHSSDYRSPEQVRGKRVVIVGASTSATEIAADMAPSVEQILHVAPHNFWAIPRFIPLVPTDPASSFLPIDLVLYRRSHRTSDNEILFKNVDDYRKANEHFRLISGGDQPASRLCANADNQPAFVAISNLYVEWSRAERIILKQGRLQRVETNGTLTLDNGTTIATTPNDVLVLCTGYRPCLDFFSSNLLEKLSYDADDVFSPLLLHRTVFHPDLSGLAFVGMYRGPFWTVIELQARWIAAIFSGALPLPSVTVQQAGIDLEHRIRIQQPRPQFPHIDFVGLADELAKEGLATIPADVSDIVVASQYRPDGPDPAILDEIQSIFNAADQGRFVAGALFRALHGTKWTFERTVKGQPADGLAHGQAQFNRWQENNNELLYTEQGELILSSIHQPLHITQKYLYVYDENNDHLSVHFIDNHNQHGALFHTIHFNPKTSLEAQQTGWTADGEHQCRPDHYSASYLFVFNGIRLIRFEIIYIVKGPAKDYVSTTRFRPVE